LKTHSTQHPAVCTSGEHLHTQLNATETHRSRFQITTKTYVWFHVRIDGQHEIWKESFQEQPKQIDDCFAINGRDEIVMTAQRNNVRCSSDSMHQITKLQCIFSHCCSKSASKISITKTVLTLNLSHCWMGVK